MLWRLHLCSQKCMAMGQNAVRASFCSAGGGSAAQGGEGWRGASTAGMGSRVVCILLRDGLSDNSQ